MFSKGMGQYCSSRKLQKFSYVGVDSSKDKYAYLMRCFINKDFLENQIKFFRSIIDEKVVEACAFSLRKEDSKNFSYKRLQSEIWNLLAKVDLDDNEDIERLKEYIKFHYLRTSSNIDNMEYVAFIVYSDWDKEFGLELLCYVAALKKINHFLLKVDCSSIGNA